MKPLNWVAALLLASGAYHATAVSTGGGGSAAIGASSGHAAGSAGGGHAADAGSHSAGGVGHSNSGQSSGGSRFGAQVVAHGSDVEGKDGAAGGIRESFGGKEAVYMRTEVGGKASVIAVLEPHEKITKADEAMLLKAGWRYQPQPEKPQNGARRGLPYTDREKKPIVVDYPMTWCRDLPANNEEGLPADGFFCVQDRSKSVRK